MKTIDSTHQQLKFLSQLDDAKLLADSILDNLWQIDEECMSVPLEHILSNLDSLAEKTSELQETLTQLTAIGTTQKQSNP